MTQGFNPARFIKGGLLCDWFRCYPSTFLAGVYESELKAEEIGYYTIILMYIYETGDADFRTLKQIGSRVKSNERAARRVVNQLIDKGRLHWVIRNRPGFIGPERALIDLKALKEMLKNCGDALESGRHIPEPVIDRIYELCDMFRECFAKELANFSEKANKNKGSFKRVIKPYKKARGASKKSMSQRGESGVELQAVPDDGTIERTVFDKVCRRHGQVVWAAWFGPDKITITTDTIRPATGFIRTRLIQDYEDLVNSLGLSIGDILPARKKGAAK